MRYDFWRPMLVAAAILACLPALAAEPVTNLATEATKSAEQKVLDNWLGEWQATSKWSEAPLTPAARTVTSDVTTKRVLGGRFIQESSESSDKTTGRFMITYDPELKRYRAWWFASTGPIGEYAGEWDETSQTMTLTLLRAEPAAVVLKHHFVDADHTKSHFTVKDVSGKLLMNMESTAVRKKEQKRD